MEDIEEIENVNIDYEHVKKEMDKKIEKNQPYPASNYKTIKEVFLNSTKKYEDKPLIWQKPNHKEPYKSYTYKKFAEDVNSLGTKLIKMLPQGSKVVIVSETTYQWYVSYMAMLCGAAIAVPVDKELPDNELENIINRAKATAVIYSEKKKDSIKKIEGSIPSVKCFIEMDSEEYIVGKNVGLNYLIKEGKELLESKDSSFIDIQIDPEEFKVLIFTSGTTSKSKGVMLCNRNLAENINAVSAYVKLSPEDKLISILSDSNKQF